MKKEDENSINELKKIYAQRNKSLKRDDEDSFSITDDLESELGDDLESSLLSDDRIEGNDFGDIDYFDELSSHLNEDDVDDENEDDSDDRIDDQESRQRASELRKIANRRSNLHNYEYLEDKDIVENLADAQQAVNRSSSVDNLPKMTKMMDEPLESDIQIPIEKAADPGDSDKTKKIAQVVFGSLGAVIAIALLIIAFNPKEQVPEVKQGQSIIAGEQIDNSKRNSNPAPTQTKATTPSSDTNVAVPRGGSKITYEITAEGDIKGVSLSWMDGNGIPDSQIDATLPFSKTIGARASVSPMMKANSSGYGTLTCKIKKNGKTINEQTISGDSPSIECSA